TVQLATDLTFRCPTVALSRLAASQGGKVWQYQFDYGATVAHSSELRYVFDAPVPGAPPLQRYWVNFVRTGDPNGDALPTWPRYEATTRAYLSFTDAGAICALRDTP
ncbi:MAG: carboxylesterase, partial [Sphingomonas sp.]